MQASGRAGAQTHRGAQTAGEHARTINTARPLPAARRPCICAPARASCMGARGPRGGESQHQEAARGARPARRAQQGARRPTTSSIDCPPAARSLPILGPLFPATAGAPRGRPQIRWAEKWGPPFLAAYWNSRHTRAPLSRPRRQLIISSAAHLRLGRSRAQEACIQRRLGRAQSLARGRRCANDN